MSNVRPTGKTPARKPAAARNGCPTSQNLGKSLKILTAALSPGVAYWGYPDFG